jgi:hypothetical protein
MFGWDHHDDVIGENQVYTMLLKGGRNVAALYQRNDQQAKLGLPSHWSGYVSVADADTTIGRVKEAGGQVVLEPLDVFDIGRMAVFLDPTGAKLCVWQPKKHIGTQLRDEPGVVCWNELLTNDPERAGAFLAKVFDWRIRSESTAGIPYTLFMNGDREAAGMMKIQPEWGEMPPNWLTYFAVDDCDAAVERAQRLDGRLLAGPYEIPDVGHIAVVADPTGATFGLAKFTARTC